VAPAAHRSGPIKGPLERVPPRSRVNTSLERVPPRSRANAYLERVPPRSKAHATSSGFRLARGLTPPRAGSASLEDSRHLERVPPRSRVPHKHTCSCTRVRAFNALTQQSRTITNHALALFRQLPRGNPSPSLWGTVRHGQCQLRDTVPPTPVWLTRRTLEGGPAAPSNPSLMTLQGQTVTSGRRERHPRHCQFCADIPAPAVPRRSLLQQLRRC
jgi:hypothetical protein